MKIYHVILEPRDIFCLYARDDKYITKVTDEIYPYPATRSRWNGKYIASSSQNLPYNPDKIIFPTFMMIKEDFIFFLDIEVGIDGWGKPHYEYPVVNDYAQKIVDQYLRLKVFW